MRLIKKLKNVWIIPKEFQEKNTLNYLKRFILIKTLRVKKKQKNIFRI